MRENLEVEVLELVVEELLPSVEGVEVEVGGEEVVSLGVGADELLDELLLLHASVLDLHSLEGGELLEDALLLGVSGLAGLAAESQLLRAAVAGIVRVRLGTQPVEIESERSWSEAAGIEIEWGVIGDGGGWQVGLLRTVAVSVVLVGLGLLGGVTALGVLFAVAFGATALAAALLLRLPPPVTRVSVAARFSTHRRLCRPQLQDLPGRDLLLLR